MTTHRATVVAFRPSGRGRQPAEVEALRDARDELTALIDEGREVSLRGVALTRHAQVLLARGQSPATVLDELERLFVREANRMQAAGVAVRAESTCPDGLDSLNHGRAA